MDVSQGSGSVYLMPFLGVVISAFTLKEHITATMIIGGVVTLGGTILITSLSRLLCKGGRRRCATSERGRHALARLKLVAANC